MTVFVVDCEERGMPSVPVDNRCCPSVLSWVEEKAGRCPDFFSGYKFIV